MTTWTQLQTDLPLFTARTDLGARLSGFTAIFEGRAKRKLRVRRMETAFSGTIVDNLIALPTGWIGFKDLWQAGYRPMKPANLDRVLALGRTSGPPTCYAVDGANVRFDGSGDVLGVYYAAIPGIESATSNWLSVNHYDAYLFGVLAEAANYLKDDAEFQKNYARSDAILDEINAADRRDRFGGPLVARAR